LLTVINGKTLGKYLDKSCSLDKVASMHVLTMNWDAQQAGVAVGKDDKLVAQKIIYINCVVSRAFILYNIW